MAGGDAIRAKLDGVVEKCLEFDFRVAQDVGVRCAPSLVFAQKITEHALPVFRGEIHRFDGDADIVGHRHGIQEVLA